MPFLVPLPLAEVDAGAVFAAGTVAFGGAGGLGMSIPIGPFVLVDVIGRDWLLPVGGRLRQVLTGSLGITFAAPSR